MACVLKQQTNGSVQGPTGATVTVAVRSKQTASTVQIFYAGTQDGQAPFQFTIQQGLNKLLIAALGVTNGQRMSVVEVDGAQDCNPPLQIFFWSSTSFFTALDIVGV